MGWIIIYEINHSISRHFALTVIYKSKWSNSTRYNNKDKYPSFRGTNYLDCIINDPRHDLNRPALIPNCKPVLKVSRIFNTYIITDTRYINHTIRKIQHKSWFRYKSHLKSYIKLFKHSQSNETSTTSSTMIRVARNNIIIAR